jgi:hypothetical protein
VEGSVGRYLALDMDGGGTERERKRRRRAGRRAFV